MNTETTTRPHASTPALGSGAMFDAIAPRYDLLNRIISLGIDRRWRKQTARVLDAMPDEIDLLDLATGTGDLALSIMQHRAKARLGCTHVVGVDPSPRMLDLAEPKFERHLAAFPERLDSFDLHVGDAQALPFAEATFDAVTISFGIRNVPDRDLALREMRRVTRPGGYVLILELSEPKPGILGAGARLHVHHVVPFVGGLISGSSEYRYLQRSIAAFPPAHVFRQHIAAAGLRVEAVCPMTFGACQLYVARVDP